MAPAVHIYSRKTFLSVFYYRTLVLVLLIVMFSFFSAFILRRCRLVSQSLSGWVRLTRLRSFSAGALPCRPTGSPGSSTPPPSQSTTTGTPLLIQLFVCFFQLQLLKEVSLLHFYSVLFSARHRFARS